MDLKIQLPKELEELYGKPNYLEVDEVIFQVAGLWNLKILY